MGLKPLSFGPFWQCDRFRRQFGRVILKFGVTVGMFVYIWGGVLYSDLDLSLT